MKKCLYENSCPAVKELPDGSFLVIGKKRDGSGAAAVGVARDNGLSVAEDESAVFVPRDVMLEELGNQERAARGRS